MDDNGQVFIVQVLVEQIAQLRLGPNQVDPHREAARGKNRPANLRFRSFVGTEGVQRDVDDDRGSA